jgi:YesN/AraC family two-component response regulator
MWERVQLIGGKLNVQSSIGHGTKIQVVISYDQELFRQGLQGLLQLEADFEIVGEAGNGQQAIELVAQLQPDVVLMDIEYLE